MGDWFRTRKPLVYFAADQLNRSEVVTMGTYLSTPVTEKGQEEGESHGSSLKWGVVDMQGWRKTMEDAHIARTDVTLGGCNNAHVFGVFDGHGGPEVARLTALYLVSVLQQQYGSGEDKTMAQALVETFHALDRMIDDANRQDELIRLRATSPAAAEQREALAIPPKIAEAAVPPNTPAPPDIEARSVTPEGGRSDSSSDSTEISAGSKEEDIANKIDEDPEDVDSLEPEGKEEASELDQDISSDEDEDEGLAIAEIDSTTDSNSSSEQPLAATLVVSNTENPAAVEPPQASAGDALEQNSSTGSSSSSAAAVGKVSGMFQRFLKLSGPTGHGILHVGKNGVLSAGPPHAATLNSPNASKPSIVRNGQMTCNLPDHPIHAGATAIVAVLSGRTLTVANAGDSRAVLCRGGGVTVALSFDHKPMQVTEMTRIRAAGGFVNAFGRVNGNLNLSRSIGDLKYKQVPGLTPAQQMITAEPDLLEYVSSERSLSCFLL